MKKLNLSAFAIFALLLGGCSTTIGSFNPATNFDYPNSNVKALGHVSASLDKMSFLIPPSWSAEEVKTMIDQAISQKSGATMLINYKTNTTFTTYILPIYSSTMTIEGTAASMEIGRQDLE